MKNRKCRFIKNKFFQYMNVGYLCNDKVIEKYKYKKFNLSNRT